MENNTEYLLEKVQELNATITLCLVCKKMKAMLICDGCNTPCCGPCLKSTILIIENPNMYGQVYSPLMLKRCPKCFISRKVCSDTQEIGGSSCCIQ